MNHYEAKQEARRARLAARAERLAGEAQGQFKRSTEIAHSWPMGQPVLVGHHSEKRHRRDIKRMDDAMRKGVELSKAADEAASRAASVGSAGVSSDDPDAVAKLKEKLAGLEAAHKRMVDINAVLRRRLGDEGKAAALLALGCSTKLAAQVMTPDYMGRLGFPSYALQNSSANIRRVKERVAELEANATRVERVVEIEDVGASVARSGEVVAGVTLRENVEANRLQLIFPGKPSPAIRALLKSHGFRWAPSESAWQRHLNGNARFAADMVVRALKSETP